jgi:hypothetical protein
MLERLDVPSPLVAKERQEMAKVLFARTASRQVPDAPGSAAEARGGIRAAAVGPPRYAA